MVTNERATRVLIGSPVLGAELGRVVLLLRAHESTRHVPGGEDALVHTRESTVDKKLISTNSRVQAERCVHHILAHARLAHVQMLQAVANA